MAGTWERTKQPCVYVQTRTRKGPSGRPIEWKRYKASFRDADGVVTSLTFDSRKWTDAYAEAVAQVSKIRTDRRGGAPLPSASKSKKTLADAWDQLVATWRGKPSTLAAYEVRWRVHLAPVLGRRRTVSLRRPELEAFLTDLEGRTTLETRRKVQALLHKVLAVAVHAQWLTVNPADGIEMPSAVVKRQPQALTDEEVERIANEVPPRYRALVLTLAETGMRVGEAVALRVKNLDGTIRVVENAPEVGGRRVVVTPKTEGSERNVPVSPRLRAILRDHLNTYANRFDPESLVFTTEHGQPARQNNFRKRIFQPACRRAGVMRNQRGREDEPPTVHDLRHSAISLWLARGLTPFETAKMVGHANLKMIEKRYGHIYDKALQKRIDELSEQGQQ